MRAPQAQTAYGKLPLAFEENRGQAAPAVRFIARGGNAEALLAPAEADLVQLDQGSVLRMRLLHADLKARIEGLDPLAFRSNYLLGSMADNRRTGIPNYSRVRYRQIYPGIDLIFYGNERRLEFDFRLAPSADSKRIGLSFGGAEKIGINKEGDLVIETRAGPIRYHKPKAFQEGIGASKEISVRYVIKGNAVGFELGPHDWALPITIDPLIYGKITAFGTFSSIAVDQQGNAYVAGSTDSATLPVTPGVVQPTLAPGTCGAPGPGFPCFDAFVAKLNPQGTSWLSVTYLGGGGNDFADQIALDAAGDVVLTGTTQSADFPTTPDALRRMFVGTVPPGSARANGFVAKLSNDLSRLIYSTYYGDSVNGLAVDVAGNAYVCGEVSQTSVPPTPGVLGSKPTGHFISKVNPAGSGVVYSTYFQAGCSAITIDASGSAYVTGRADASLPTTPGAFQPTWHDNHPTPETQPASDGYAAKISPDASTLVYSTFLGGTQADFGLAIAVDSKGNAYVAGETYSVDFPVTPGAFWTTPLGNSNGTQIAGFLTKVDSRGSVALYSTLFPGGGLTEVVVDAAGDAFVTGSLTTNQLPSSPGALDSCNGGANHAVFAELNPQGAALLYSTYLGGAFAMDSVADVYMAGRTSSATFPTTDGSKLPPSDPGAFVAKFDLAPGPPLGYSCIVNAASYAGSPVAPGEIITIFHPGLGPQNPAYATLDSQGLLSTQLANTQVLFDGTPAPLLYVQANQINLIVPFAVAGNTDTQIQVVFNGQSTNAVDYPVAQSAPGIFWTVTPDGYSVAAILNQDETPNGPRNPALAGSIISVYSTGAGETTPAGADGRIDPGTFATPVAPVSVFINEQQVETLYTGQAPGEVDGVLQVNAKVPNLMSRNIFTMMPVYLKAGNAVSNTVFVYVKPSGQ